MPNSLLVEHVLNLLGGKGAHAGFDEAVKHFPAELRGKKIRGADHTAWQLLEHMRIAQWDILEFSRDPEHVSPKFPEGYWPESAAPASDSAWKKSIANFRHDLEEISSSLVMRVKRNFISAFLTAMDKPCCARRWCSPITMRITWGSS